MASHLQKIKLVTNPNYKKSGPKSYVWLMQKYGFQPTKEGPYFVGNNIREQAEHGAHALYGGRAHMQMVLEKKTGTNTVGEVTAEDVQNDALYLAPVSIGTPPQTLNLDYDTGSADLWVWSTQLPPAIKRAGAATHKIFDPSKSSTFKNSAGSSWKITYGDQSSASGSVGTDTVVIGGLSVEKQAVELAKNISAQFQQFSGDGLLGLAFGQINTVTPRPVKTPVENMIAQADIPKTQELFTAKLGSWRDANEPDQGESFFTFGYIDQATITASGQQIYYTPVDSSQGFWQFDSTSATVNGKTINRRGNTAMADTGTTLALIDDATCQAIYDAIPGATYDNDSQGYIFPTNTTEAKLPVVTLAVGGKQFAIQKEDLGFVEAKPGFLYGGIQSRGNLSFDILGDTFLKAIYAIFDQGNTRFGAVQRKELTQNLTPPPAEG
ncbi:hypothetical protein MMC16_004702 [Acarospora aff. strigata]|nr:hypothetical protein [Acarospora aff. strigata]